MVNSSSETDSQKLLFKVEVAYLGFCIYSMMCYWQANYLKICLDVLIFKANIWNKHVECWFLERKGNARAQKKTFFDVRILLDNGNWRLSCWGCASILDLIFHLYFILCMHCSVRLLTEQVSVEMTLDLWLCFKEALECYRENGNNTNEASEEGMVSCGCNTFGSKEPQFLYVKKKFVLNF